MYTERHDDRYGGRVPSKKGNTKMDILKIIFSLTGRHYFPTKANVVNTISLNRLFENSSH